MIFTAHERKMLALIQRRTGPAVIGVRGRLQCIADSLKLLLKTFISARNINSSMFQLAAMGGFWISWFNFSNLTYGPGLRIIDIEYNLFFLLFISIVFSIIWLMTGWSSISKYAILGCYRAIIQIIAFELLLGSIFLIIYVVFNCFNFELIVQKQEYICLFLVHPPIAILTLFIFFMETNRPPFDLSEAESDLVAGYNVEYGGFLFGLFYLCEYINLFTACTILIILFNGGWNSYFMMFIDLWTYIIQLL